MWLHPQDIQGPGIPWSSEPLDTRGQATVLAALAFYRDNMLSYGAVPGQLSAEECNQLIAKLQPAEEVPSE